MATLGVNIDHVATVREARKTYEPDPIWAAAMAELGGADCITIHLREDRRHINDRDLRILKETVTVKLNLEMGLTDEIIKIALKTSPQQVCFVPEKRQEVTTEGGLDVTGRKKLIKDVIRKFHRKGIDVSLFIDPERKQIDAAKDVRADSVELHTGRYANATTSKETQDAFEELIHCGMYTLVDLLAFRIDE